MGNICDAIGLSRKEPSRLDNIAANGNSSSANANATDVPIDDDGAVDEEAVKSPVVAASSAALSMAADAVKAAELRAAYIRKQNEEAEAAALAKMTGPRIRLLPHQHSLFCERKQRVCASSGQLQELEVIVLEGFDGPLPPFTWIRIKPNDLHYFGEDYEGLIESDWYQEVQQEHALDEQGHPAHSENEYVLTREDVGHYIGVRYDVVSEVQVLAVAAEEPVQAPPVALDQGPEQPAGQLPIGAAIDEAMRILSADAVDTSAAATTAQEPQQEKKEHEQVDAHHAAHTVARAVEHKFLVLSRHGVVKPGPPRLTTFNITGSMKVNTVATVEVCYIGGYEGLSEYWWMRITPDGRRIQVTDPQRVPFPSSAARQHSSAEFATRASFSLSKSLAADALMAASTEGGEAGAGEVAQAGPVRMNLSVDPARPPTASFSARFGIDESQVDPRMYLLTEDDLGCILKAKCRPARNDGQEGEIFTSTPSEEVVE